MLTHLQRRGLAPLKTAWHVWRRSEGKSTGPARLPHHRGQHWVSKWQGTTLGEWGMEALQRALLTWTSFLEDWGRTQARAKSSQQPPRLPFAGRNRSRISLTGERLPAGRVQRQEGRDIRFNCKANSINSIWVVGSEQWGAGWERAFLVRRSIMISITKRAWA